MARIRTLKPEFWQDEKLAPLPVIDRLVFLGLISQADDAGRLVDSIRLIDGLLFPHTDDTCATSLDALAELGVIERGITASGQAVIQIVKWGHQKIDKPNLSSALPAIAIARHTRRVPVKLRQAIYERDGGICRSCGTQTHLEKGHPRYGGDDCLAEVDHVKALADGGDNDPSNLQLLCKKCNRAKAGSAARQRVSEIRGNVGDESATDRRPISVPTTYDQRSTNGTVSNETEGEPREVKPDAKAIHSTLAPLVREHLWLGKKPPPNGNGPPWTMDRELALAKQIMADRSIELAEMVEVVKYARAVLEFGQDEKLTLRIFNVNGRGDRLGDVLGYVRKRAEREVGNRGLTQVDRLFS